MDNLSITQLRINGLHGSQNVDLQIADNRLVIVGVNGIGKSTVLNILYYFLSRQWSKLREVKFDSLFVEINGDPIKVSRSDITQHFFSVSALRHSLPPGLSRRLEALRDTPMFQSLLAHEISAFQARELASHLEVPASVVARIRDDFLANPDLATDTQIAKVSEALAKVVKGKILFLPTYRRIERDLRHIVPDIEEKFRAYRNRQASSQVFDELIEFGMDDIKRMYAATLNAITDLERNEFNDLIGTYLSQVLHGMGANFDYARIMKFKNEQMDTVISRLKDDTLKVDDRNHLRDVISKVISTMKPEDLQEQERYVALFFENLISTSKTLEANEVGVTSLAFFCNRYLFGKEMKYDRRSSSIEIRRSNDNSLIDLADLSSGEKQIVALFSHLCLNQGERYIILIDEPELSLGVEWQRTLLPDIWKTNKCAFLASVTHSPFIFENEFDPYAQDLQSRILSAE